MDESLYKFSMTIASEADRETVISTLSEHGAEIEKRAGFDPLTIIAFVAGLTVVVRAVRDLVRDHRGVLIDATTEPKQIREMPGWKSSQVVVLTTDGPVFHEFDDSDDGLQTLISSMGAA